MNDLSFTQMQHIQKELQEKYKNIWKPNTPENATRQLLWLYGELAEVGDILKKKGHDAVMNDPEVRREFVEEMCDVMMYFNDVMGCYGISVDELREIYLKKHERNMKRWKTE